MFFFLNFFYIFVIYTKRYIKPHIFKKKTVRFILKNKNKLDFFFTFSSKQSFFLFAIKSEKVFRVAISRNNAWNISLVYATGFTAFSTKLTGCGMQYVMVVFTDTTRASSVIICCSSSFSFFSRMSILIGAVLERFPVSISG